MAAACAAASPVKFNPTSVMKFDYFAFTCPDLGSGPCSDLLVKTPVPGVWVTLTITAIPGSAHHTHELTQTGRPPASFLTPQRAQTGVDGWVHWWVGFTGWAGDYNLLETPEDKAGLHFPNVLDTISFAVTIDDKNGLPKTFDKFKAGIYSPPAPTDARHSDGLGNFVYNTWGASSCVKAAQKAASQYYDNPFNQGQFHLIMKRFSLPDGGKADNEIDANNNYLFTPWLTRKGEGHANGISFDTLNAKLSADPNNSAAQYIQFDSMTGIMFKNGIRLGKTDAWGATLGDKAAVTTYWFNQPINHWVCLSEPLLEP